MLRVLLSLLVALLFVLNPQFVSSSKVIEKYPSNAYKKFPTADQFYNEIARDEYTEPANPIYKLRLLVSYKDVNHVFKHVPYQVTGVGNGNGFNPERQVYVFVSTGSKNNQIYYQHAVFDAETRRKISGAAGTTN